MRINFSVLTVRKGLLQGHLNLTIYALSHFVYVKKHPSQVDGPGGPSPPIAVCFSSNI